VLDGWRIENGGLTVELDEFFVAFEHRNQGAGAQAIAAAQNLVRRTRRGVYGYGNHA
jgi:hypothetical protein